MSGTFHLKLGDRLPTLFYRLEDGSGQPVDLTDSSVQFRLRRPGGAALNAEAVVANGTYTLLSGDQMTFTPADGVVHYEWGASDVQVAGKHRAEFVVTFPGGKQGTFPNDGFISVSVSDRVPAA